MEPDAVHFGKRASADATGSTSNGRVKAVAQGPSRASEFLLGRAGCTGKAMTPRMITADRELVASRKRTMTKASMILREMVLVSMDIEEGPWSLGCPG